MLALIELAIVQLLIAAKAASAAPEISVANRKLEVELEEVEGGSKIGGMAATPEGSVVPARGAPPGAVPGRRAIPPPRMTGQRVKGAES